MAEIPRFLGDSDLRMTLMWRRGWGMDTGPDYFGSSDHRQYDESLGGGGRRGMDTGPEYFGISDFRR